MIKQNNINNKDLQNKLKSILCNESFTWNFADSIMEKDKIIGHSGLGHIFCKDNFVSSQYADGCLELLNYIIKKENLTIKNVHRIQANLLPNINVTEQQLKEAIHQDTKFDNYISLIYYVIDSDGNTILFNKDNNIEYEIEPKEGDYIIFASNTFHRASVPTNHNKRIVINYILEI